METVSPSRGKRQQTVAPITFFPRKRRRKVDPAALALVQKLLGDEPRHRDLLIEHLHRLQDAVGYLDIKHLQALATEMKISATEVHEVASFYHHFDIVREGETPPPPLTVRVCESVSCSMAGADELTVALQQGLGSNIRVQKVPCVGRCAQAPVAVIGTQPVARADAPTVISKVKLGETVDSPEDGWIGYYDYCKDGGYQTLQRCLDGELQAEEIITCLKDSSLRGLGGAGFPVGMKWEIVRSQAAPRLLSLIHI